jgi:hypothetical protein
VKDAEAKKQSQTLTFTNFNLTFEKKKLHWFVKICPTAPPSPWQGGVGRGAFETFTPKKTPPQFYPPSGLFFVILSSKVFYFKNCIKLYERYLYFSGGFPFSFFGFDNPASPFELGSVESFGYQ